MHRTAAAHASPRLFNAIAGSILAVAMWLIVAVPSYAQTPPACKFILGFQTLHDLDPADTGDCLDNQAFASNGDALQHTTNGLLVWRKADNWTAFTNGYRTWINSKFGLRQRLNSERFEWEGAPALTSQLSQQAQLPDGRGYASYVWAGYVTFRQVTMVSGSWVVPSVTDTSNESEGEWVGLDDDATLLQAGTDSNRQQAWIELFPDPALFIPKATLRANQGDAFSVTITALGGGQWSVRLQNQTTGDVYQVTRQFDGAPKRAECIEETPVKGAYVDTPMRAPYPRFSPVPFTACSVNAVPMAQQDPMYTVRVDPNNAPVAVPSAIKPDGSFSVARR